MFHASILQIQEELHYHQQQQEKLEQELYTLKSYEEFAGEAFDSVRDTIEQIEDPKCLELFKESLLSLFPDPPIYLEEKEPVVFNPPQPDIPHTVEEDEQPSIVKLSDNVIYDQDTDCIHIGFRLSSDGYAWREQLIYKQKLSTKSWFEKSEHLVEYPKELIIESISLEQAKELVETCDFSKPPIQEPVEVREELYEKPHYPDPKIPINLADYTPGQTPVNKVEIAPGIIYIPVDKTAFVGMRAKGRARTYGDMLTRVLDIGSKYLVTDRLTVIKDAKYEFRIFDISFEDVKQLAKFNLSKDYDAKENKEVREVWRTTRKREVPPAYKPSPKLTPLEEIKLGDIVYLNSIDNQYKVLQKVELDGVPHIEVICVFNSERPSLVSEISYLKECYLVPAESIQIDSQFQSPEKPEVKKSEGSTAAHDVHTSADDFPSSPYKLIPLSEVELADIVTTSPNSQSAYEVTANLGDHLLATCLYNKSLKHREGQKDFWITEAYLVQKASISPTVEAA